MVGTRYQIITTLPSYDKKKIILTNQNQSNKYLKYFQRPRVKIRIFEKGYARLVFELLFYIFCEPFRTRNIYILIATPCTCNILSVTTAHRTHSRPFSHTPAAQRRRGSVFYREWYLLASNLTSLDPSWFLVPTLHEQHIRRVNDDVTNFLKFIARVGQHR